MQCIIYNHSGKGQKNYRNLKKTVCATVTIIKVIKVRLIWTINLRRVLNTEATTRKGKIFINIIYPIFPEPKSNSFYMWKENPLSVQTECKNSSRRRIWNCKTAPILGTYFYKDCPSWYGYYTLSNPICYVSGLFNYCHLHFLFPLQKSVLRLSSEQHMVTVKDCMPGLTVCSTKAWPHWPIW